jgi:hypothetical protein
MKSFDIQESLKYIMEEEGTYRINVRGNQASWGEIGYLFTLKVVPIGESRKYKVMIEGVSKDKRRSDLDVNLIFSSPKNGIYEGGFYSLQDARAIFESVVKGLKSKGLRGILEDFHPIGAGFSVADLIDLYRDPR